MTFWHRVAGIVLFLVGGGAATTSGAIGLTAWLGSLVRGERVIQTDSFVLGLPLIGASMVLLAPELIAPRAVARWSEWWRTRFGLMALGIMLAGVVLVLLGQLVIDAAMEVDGYRPCHVGGRGRVTEVTWARDAAECPAELGR